MTERDAIGLAVADAGLRKEDIDGLITSRNLHTREGIDEQIGRLLGISPRFSATLDFSLVH